MRRLKFAWAPNDGPQTAFLASTAREVLYGGAAGGGKTESIMQLPFYRIHNPRHRSLILRRTRPQLQEVIDRQLELYPKVAPGARWRQNESRWIWPSGAITQMGYMEHEADRYKFKTFEYDQILFDELTSFTKKQYLFMFSRNRSKDITMPAIMRGGTNPGDVGHQWVYERFIAGSEPYMTYRAEEAVEVEGMGAMTIETTKQFIPAKLADNPKMADRGSYIAGLREMGEDGEAYLSGDWTAFSGQMFPRFPQEGPPLAWEPGCLVIRTMDYGFADPMCMYWLRVRANGMVEIMHELYSPNLTTDSIALYAARVEREVLKINPAISVASVDMFSKKDTGTGQGQSIATMLQQRGLWFEEANNQRVAGWARLRSLIRREMLYVWEGAAPNLKRTLTNLVRDPEKPEDVKDRQEDHAAEALRYGIMAIPERGIVPTVGHLAPQTIVVEHDPVWKKFLQDLQNPGQGVIFPGLEGGE